MTRALAISSNFAWYADALGHVGVNQTAPAIRRMARATDGTLSDLQIFPITGAVFATTSQQNDLLQVYFACVLFILLLTPTAVGASMGVHTWPRCARRRQWR